MSQQDEGVAQERDRHRVQEAEDQRRAEGRIFAEHRQRGVPGREGSRRGRQGDRVRREQDRGPREHLQGKKGTGTFI